MKLAQFVQPPAACHYATVLFRSKKLAEPHNHDFVEIFWIESGQGWHWINGKRQPLTVGTLCFIRAKDRHTFCSAGAEPMRLVNVAFARHTWSALSQRYDLSDPFDGWPPDPKQIILSERQMILEQAAADELRSGRVDRLATDRFLLNLHRLIEPARSEASASSQQIPHWLRRTLEALDARDGNDVPLSTTELARLADVTPEHLARTIRRLLNRTPTDLLNESKIVRAATRLAHTDDPILNVAIDSGFENLSHFYKVFRARFGLTPRRYRLHQQFIISACRENGNYRWNQRKRLIRM